MNFIKYFSLFLLLLLWEAEAQIAWNGNNWALACDFPGNDMYNVQIAGEQCGSACANANGCTHFAWSTWNGGTCFLKSGKVTKANAVFTNDYSMVCGVIIEDGSGSLTTNNPGNNNQFPSCKFRFGTSYDSGSAFDAADYITVWIGYGGQFSDGYHGAMLRTSLQKNKMPVFYGYIIAFMARAEWGLQDCNVGDYNLCKKGADYIRANRGKIVDMYNNYATEAAKIVGREFTMIWQIEPDFWQYYGQPTQENGGLSGTYMRAFYDDIAKAIRNNLPNAKIAWDISPWLSQQAMMTWWGYFATSPYVDFLFTSGGETRGDLAEIRPGQLSWAFMSTLTGRRIIADTGYGVAGIGTGHDWAYDDVNNLRARISNGVIAVTQANPRGDWGSILNNVRPNLPNLC